MFLSSLQSFVRQDPQVDMNAVADLMIIWAFATAISMMITRPLSCFSIFNEEASYQ